MDLFCSASNNFICSLESVISWFHVVWIMSIRVLQHQFDYIRNKGHKADRFLVHNRYLNVSCKNKEYSMCNEKQIMFRSTWKCCTGWCFWRPGMQMIQKMVPLVTKARSRNFCISAGFFELVSRKVIIFWKSDFLVLYLPFPEQMMLGYRDPSRAHL